MQNSQEGIVQNAKIPTSENVPNHQMYYVCFMTHIEPTGLSLPANEHHHSETSIFPENYPNINKGKQYRLYVDKVNFIWETKNVQAK